MQAHYDRLQVPRDRSDITWTRRMTTREPTGAQQERPFIAHESACSSGSSSGPSRPSTPTGVPSSELSDPSLPRELRLLEESDAEPSGPLPFQHCLQYV